MNQQENFPTPEANEKQRRWNEVAERVGRTVDKLEYPVDEGIKEGVIALNVLDINTHASCEGHLDHGIAAPWIDIQAKVSAELRQRGQILFKDKEGNREKLKELSGELERKNLEEQKKIFPFLDDFYKGKDVPFDRRLIVVVGGLGRLESQGASIQKIEDEAAKQKKLQEYQDEMNAFIAFLKERYFEEEK